MKRIIDILVGSLLLFLFSPFFVLISGYLYLKRVTPIVLMLPRITHSGRRFNLYVFNFMKLLRLSFLQIPEDVSLSVFETVIYYLGLYKLPMLLNVLKGDLAILGPTAEYPGMFPSVEEANGKTNGRAIRPGLIGESYFCDFGSFRRPMIIEKSLLETYRKKYFPLKSQKEQSFLKEKSRAKWLRLVIRSACNRVRNIFQDSVRSGMRSYNILVPIDLFLIIVSYWGAYSLRFEWQIPAKDLRIFWISMPILVAIRIFVFERFGLYRYIWKYVNIRDVIKIIEAVTLSTLVAITLLFFFGLGGGSRSVFVIDWILVILMIGGVRAVLRYLNERRTGYSEFRKNILIYGAGDLGEALLRELERNAKDKYNILGFIDDDPQKIGLTVHGIRILGGKETIPQYARVLRIDEIFIAIASISSSLMRDIVSFCKKADIRYRIAPAINDSLNGSTRINRIRNVEISDLFGRNQIKMDVSSIKQILAGKTILVTGAGGSIGSELCRQIYEYNPKDIVLIDKNENYLHDIRVELSHRSGSVRIHSYLCDITNEPKIRSIFDKVRPDIVCHAAAQKHVPLSEENPDEAINANIRGTQIVADLADEFEVQRFLLISTDKAVNPTSLMGATKRVAELYVLALGKQSKTTFVVVRFGNVLNSNGSVLPTFIKQIERGGPITVTHKDIERFFMSIDEAVQLILQAISMGVNGELYILEMGNAIKIVQLAEDLIRLMGDRPYVDIDIVFTGLRPGEKLYEELVGAGETVQKTKHEFIKAIQLSHLPDFQVLRAKLSTILEANGNLGSREIKERLREIVPEYDPWLVEEGDVESKNRQHVKGKSAVSV